MNRLIANTRKIFGVVAQGHIIDRAALDRMLTETPAAVAQPPGPSDPREK
jgi:hypothetical protein